MGIPNSCFIEEIASLPQKMTFTTRHCLQLRKIYEKCHIRIQFSISLPNTTCIFLVSRLLIPNLTAAQEHLHRHPLCLIQLHFNLLLILCWSLALYLQSAGIIPQIVPSSPNDSPPNHKFICCAIDFSCV